MKLAPLTPAVRRRETMIFYLVCLVLFLWWWCSMLDNRLYRERQHNRELRSYIESIHEI